MIPYAIQVPCFQAPVYLSLITTGLSQNGVLLSLSEIQETAEGLSSPKLVFHLKHLLFLESHIGMKACRRCRLIFQQELVVCHQGCLFHLVMASSASPPPPQKPETVL
jgi:hypothetical protein